MAVRASSTGFIHMDEVFCPEELKLPGVKSMRGPLSALSNARFGICWGGMGAAACTVSSMARAMARSSTGPFFAM